MTLTKTAETEDWQDIIPTIRQFWKITWKKANQWWLKKKWRKKATNSNEVSADDDDVVKRIKELLENYVKPPLKWTVVPYSLKAMKMVWWTWPCREVAAAALQHHYFKKVLRVWWSVWFLK